MNRSTFFTRAFSEAPEAEIIFLPTLPVRVEEVNVALGDAASGPVMKVTNNQLIIDSSPRLEDVPLVKPGMAVAIDKPDLGLKAIWAYSIRGSILT